MHIETWQRYSFFFKLMLDNKSSSLNIRQAKAYKNLRNLEIKHKIWVIRFTTRSKINCLKLTKKKKKLVTFSVIRDCTTIFFHVIRSKLRPKNLIKINYSVNIFTVWLTGRAQQRSRYYFTKIIFWASLVYN